MIYPIINYNNTDIPTNNELPYMNNTNINVFSDTDILLYCLAGCLLLYSFGGAICDIRKKCRDKYNNYRHTTQLQNYLLSREFVEPETSESLIDECTICLEHFSPRQMSIQLSCGHKFHSQCIMEWLQNELICPNCRAPLEI